MVVGGAHWDVLGESLQGFEGGLYLAGTWTSPPVSAYREDGVAQSFPGVENFLRPLPATPQDRVAVPGPDGVHGGCTVVK